MKKFLFIIILVMVSVFVFADETSDVTAVKLYKKGYEAILASSLNTEITVVLSDIDMTIRGVLVAYYEDGIYIRTAFKNDIFVMKDSIAYIKVKTFEE